jgi:hypothetical protein
MVLFTRGLPLQWLEAMYCCSEHTVCSPAGRQEQNRTYLHPCSLRHKDSYRVRPVTCVDTGAIISMLRLHTVQPAPKCAADCRGLGRGVCSALAIPTTQLWHAGLKEVHCWSDAVVLTNAAIWLPTATVVLLAVIVACSLLWSFLLMVPMQTSTGKLVGNKP